MNLSILNVGLSSWNQLQFYLMLWNSTGMAPISSIISTESFIQLYLTQKNQLLSPHLTSIHIIQNKMQKTDASLICIKCNHHNTKIQFVAHKSKFNLRKYVFPFLFSFIFIFITLYLLVVIFFSSLYGKWNWNSDMCDVY